MYSLKHISEWGACDGGQQQMVQSTKYQPILDDIFHLINTGANMVAIRLPNFAENITATLKIW